MTMTLLDVTSTNSSFVSAVAARTSSSSLSVTGVVVAVPSAKTWSVMSVPAAVERAASCAAGVAAVFEPAAGLLLLKLPEALIRSQEYLRHLAAK